MWDLPGPGLEPVSPALAGGFLTTAPPGKSHHHPIELLLFRRSQTLFVSLKHGFLIEGSEKKEVFWLSSAG